MNKEEIEKLAEDKCPDTFFEINGQIGKHYNHGIIPFIEGYTTCQNTEVAELNKELERVKGLLERHIKRSSISLGYTELETERYYSEFKKDYNL